MKKIGHKKQVVITTLALLIAIVGYISYDRDGNFIKETVSSKVEKENMKSAIADTEEILNPGETVLTSSMNDSVNYAAEVKLNREQVRSKNKESLLTIIDDKSLTDEQRQVAIDEMVSMAEVASKEADAEMLLAAKGFTDVVVSMGEESCDVVLNMGDVTDAKRAQVEDIVKRKTGISADKIIITTLDKSGNKLESPVSENKKGDKKMKDTKEKEK